MNRYATDIYCKWLSTLNRGITVHEYIFFQKFADILIQLVLILMRMMATPSTPRINVKGPANEETLLRKHCCGNIVSSPRKRGNIC